MHIVTHFLNHNKDISPNFVGGKKEVGAWWRLMAALEENVDDGLQASLSLHGALVIITRIVLLLLTIFIIKEE